MIGRISGRLLQKVAPLILVDVNGVGYEMEAPLSTLYQLPEIGTDVVLRTHLVVREDAHLLYAFYTETERQMFRQLLKINGVGPKLALTILSGVSTEELARAVTQNDIAMLTRLPGVGKKTAERLVIELRDKLKDIAVSPAASAQPMTNKTNDHTKLADAISALVALGYKPAEAQKMAQGLEKEFERSEDIIRAALRRMAKETV